MENAKITVNILNFCKVQNSQKSLQTETPEVDSYVEKKTQKNPKNENTQDQRQRLTRQP